MGTNKWHNADFLAVTVAVVAAEVAMVVVVPAAAAAAVPVELSLHSRVLTCLHICNPTGIVNDKKKCMNIGQVNKGTSMHTHNILLYFKNLCQMMSFVTRKNNLKHAFFFITSVQQF